VTTSGRQGRKDVRRQRLWFSAGAGLVVLLLMAPVAMVAFGRDAERARDDTEEWAAENLLLALAITRGRSAAPPDNTWEVNIVDGWDSPLGATWTDPPLQALAQNVYDGGPVREFEFNGTWTAAGTQLDDSMVLLTVVPRETQDAAIAAARLRWVMITAALAAIAAAIAWWATGRAQAPVERAHLVNRDFIADAAHELRTPLSIIQASAGHALSRDRSADAYRESRLRRLQPASPDV